MTRETKSYELKIYDQSLMRFEAVYDAFGSLKLEITDIDSANAHLLPLNLIVDQDEKSRLRGKAKIATPDTVDSLLMEAVYGDDVMGVYAKRYLTDIADLIDPFGFDSAASTEMGD